MVLICSAGKSSDLLVSRWSQSGHTLAAVVVATPKPGRTSALNRSGTPVFQVEYPVDWSKIETALCSINADLLVCYGFMRLIPASFLRMFTHGGVNFHPTLLPAYPGPHPTQCLVSDGTFRRFGGLTLHKLTECFDQGEILAQSRFFPHDYSAASTYRGVLVSTMIEMIKDVIPLYCAGNIKTKQQTKDTSTWAQYHPRCIIITSDWKAEDVAAACAFLRRHEGLIVRLQNGMLVNITGFRKRLKSAKMERSTLKLSTLDFECADARISLFRNNRLGRFLRRISNKIDKLRNVDTARVIEFETRHSH
jgi:folate-dependent phosphoribosylglycinamide formyltransferase PurN